MHREIHDQATVSTGRSSINQCPDPATTASRTLVATLRMMTACSGPKDFSPPTAAPASSTLLLEDFVVLRILRKRSELREAGSHSSRLSISGGEEISSGFIRFAQIAREVVPDPVEINAFAALDQPLRIRSMKVEMPDAGILQYRSRAGSRGLERPLLPAVRPCPDRLRHTRRRPCFQCRGRQQRSCHNPTR